MNDDITDNLAPEVLALVRRAAALATRDGMPRLELSHLLEAVFFRPVTPSLVQHLLSAGAIAQDTESSAVGDLHVLLAVVEDANSLVNHLLSPLMDHGAVAAVLRDQLHEPPAQSRVAASATLHLCSSRVPTKAQSSTGLP